MANQYPVHRSGSLWQILPAVLLLGACQHGPAAQQAQTPADSAIAQDDMGEAMDEDSNIAMVAMALATGADAQQKLEQDEDLAESERRLLARRLLAAAQKLSIMGAHVDGEDGVDLAQLWLDQARRVDPALVIRPMRGRPLGPGYRKAVLAPGNMHSSEQVFLAGQKARIALVSPGNGRFRLEVSSSKGRKVCARSAGPDQGKASCQWMPVFTERYAIHITNLDRKSAPYYLVLN